MLKEFAAKRCVKLGKLLEKGALGLDPRKKDSGGSNPNPKSDHRNDYNPTKVIIINLTISKPTKSFACICKLGNSTRVVSSFNFFFVGVRVFEKLRLEGQSNFLFSVIS